MGQTIIWCMVNVIISGQLGCHYNKRCMVIVSWTNLQRAEMCQEVQQVRVVPSMMDYWISFLTAIISTLILHFEQLKHHLPSERRV